MTGLDVIDFKAYETEAEREEREAAMALDADWSEWLSETYSDDLFSTDLD